MARVSQAVIDQLLSDCADPNKPYEIVVSKWIVEKIPAIFGDNKEEFLRIKSMIAQGLNVDMCSVVFVGSSCTGFSLNPKKGFKEFDDDSDIDIAIISHHHFNVAWRWMKQVDMSTLKSNERFVIGQHRSHFIFDGTIATDFILPLLPFGAQWGAVLTAISNEPVFGGREINFRLYQDHKALIDYHVKNVKNNMPTMLGVNAQEVTLEAQVLEETE